MNALLNKGYQCGSVRQKLRKIEKENFLYKPIEESKPILTIVITDNRTLPSIKPIIEKHWHVLYFFSEKIFRESPIIAYCSNIKLKQMIRSNDIEHNKIYLNQTR